MMHTISKFLVPVFVTFMLTACGTARGNDVSLVKTGYLSFDQSVTVGNALDKYKYFKTTEWKSFITKKEQHVVEFNGIVDMDKLNYSNANFIAGSEKSWSPYVAEESVLIQFSINNDKTFNLSYMEINGKNIKGEKFKIPITPEYSSRDTFVQSIYQDKLCCGL